MPVFFHLFNQKAKGCSRLPHVFVNITTEELDIISPNLTCVKSLDHSLGFGPNAPISSFTIQQPQRFNFASNPIHWPQKGPVSSTLTLGHCFCAFPSPYRYLSGGLVTHSPQQPHTSAIFRNR